MLSFPIYTDSHSLITTSHLSRSFPLVPWLPQIFNSPEIHYLNPWLVILKSSLPSSPRLDSLIILTPSHIPWTLLPFCLPHTLHCICFERETPTEREREQEKRREREVLWSQIPWSLAWACFYETPLLFEIVGSRVQVKLSFETQISWPEQSSLLV